MTASTTPRPDDHDETPHDDATTGILAGADPDRTPTEVLADDPDRVPTQVLGDDHDRVPTQALADDLHRAPTEVLGRDSEHTTKVLPEASAHSTLVPPKPKASVPPQPTAVSQPSPRASTTPPAAVPPSAQAPRGDARTDATRSTALDDLTSGPARLHSGGPQLPRPRVRWAGIIWGVVFAVSASLLLWVLAEPSRRETVGDWWASLTPIGFGLTLLLIAGGLLLIGGVAGLARRLSHPRP